MMFKKAMVGLGFPILLAALPLAGLAAAGGKVTSLELKPGKERTMLIVNHTGDGKFRLFQSEKQGNVIIEAENLNLPPNLTKLVDASSSEGPVLQMTPYNSTVQGRPMAKLVLQLRSKADVTTSDQPGRFMVEISKKAGAGPLVAAQQKKLVRDSWSEVDELRARQAAATKSEETAKRLVEVLNTPQEEKKYFGSKVTFEAKDAEVPDIFRLVGESSDLNLVWDTDVEGQKTSLSVKDLPWDQLLDIVIQQKGFKASVMGNVVRIMTLETYNKQAKAKKEEISLSDELEPVIMAVIPLSFSEAAKMKKMIDTLIQEKTTPGATVVGQQAQQQQQTSSKEKELDQDFKRGKIEIDERTNSLVVTNTKDSIDRIRRLIKELDVPVPQVLIDAKIVIAGESLSKSIGMTWKHHLRTESSNGGTIGVFNGQDEKLGGGDTSQTEANTFTISSPKNNPAGVGLFGFGFGASSNAQLFAALELSEINGQSKTIASPRVIVNNNKTANISDGQSVTQIVPGGGGAGASRNEVNPKLSLTVIPQVTSHGSIQMKDLTITKDSLDSNDATTTKVSSKTLKTEVLVDSGATLVLGGIYQMVTTQAENGIPILKDLPFIGQFFRVNSSLYKKDELMVFITPQIIDPEATGQSL